MTDWDDRVAKAREQADEMREEVDQRIRAVPNAKAKIFATHLLAFFIGYGFHALLF